MGADSQHRALKHGGVSVFGGVGERTREGNDLRHESSRKAASSTRRTTRTRGAGLRTDDGAAGRAPASASRLTVAEHSATRKARTCSSSSTTSSASRRRVPGSVGTARPHAVGRRLSADAAQRDGPDAERITSTKKGSTHPSRRFACRPTRLHRPGAGDDVRAPRRDDEPVARDFRARHLPGSRSAGVDVAHSRSRILGEEHYGVAQREADSR